MGKPRKTPTLLVLQDLHRVERRIDSIEADMADLRDAATNLRQKLTTPATGEHDDIPDRCLNLSEAAAYLGVSLEYLSRLARGGQFPAALLPSEGETSRTWRVLPEDLRAWVRAQRVTVAQQAVAS